MKLGFAGASQGDLTRVEAPSLPAMVGATSVKVQHFASTRYATHSRCSELDSVGTVSCFTGATAFTCVCSQ